MNIKDDLMKLIKGNAMAVLAVAILVVAFVAYIIIFTPMMKEIRKKYMECRRCESEVVTTHNIIGYAKTIGKSYGGRVLMSEKEAATGLEEFTEHAKELGVNFISIKPQNIIIKEGMPYKIMPIEFELEATDKKFVDFLGSIDELKKVIVTVDNFDINPDPNDHTKLHVKMTVDIYLSAKENSLKES